MVRGGFKKLRKYINHIMTTVLFHKKIITFIKIFNYINLKFLYKLAIIVIANIKEKYVNTLALREFNFIKQL